MTRMFPDRAYLTAQMRWLMGRGLPVQVAEDIVHDAWQTALQRHDPSRGSIEALMHGIIRTEAAGWWRRRARETRIREQLELVGSSRSDSEQEEHAARCQQVLLDALSPDERRIFDAWALQRHLGKGRITAVEISASLGMTPRDYENAKRRLRTRLAAFLREAGWTARTVLHGLSEEDGDARRTQG
jgi:DNA-directed RNA polymerase specialized sigma24 family protein